MYIVYTAIYINYVTTLYVTTYITKMKESVIAVLDVWVDWGHEDRFYLGS